MKKEYIAFYCPDIYPEKTGGLELFTYYLVKDIAKKRDVILFTESKEFHDDNIKIIRIFSRLFIMRKWYFAELSYLISILVFLVTSRSKINVFHVPHTNNANGLSIIFPIIKRFLGIDYILVLHDGGMENIKNSNSHQLLFRHAKNIVAVSEASKKEYAKFIKTPIIVIPSVIPFLRSKIIRNALKDKYGFVMKDKLIIVVGSISPLKGNDIVLDAFMKLTEEYIHEQSLHLLFAGSGILKEELQLYVSESNIKPYIHFLGNIQNSDIHEIYAIADIYVIASKHESLSITTLEAMNNNLPIVASDVEALNTTIEDKYSGLLYKRGDSNELAGKFKTLLQNPDLASELGHNAKEHYEKHFSYRQTFEKHMKLYRD
jgi:glycosyltransferase involved in cell wall biosynthesis